MSDPTPRDGFRPKLSELKVNVEKSKIWAELWHKLLDRVLSSEFFTFFLVLLLTASGLAVTAVRTDLKDIIEYWKLILPIVTLYIGYAFGKKQAD
jgi:hypothetical protein